MKEHLKDYVENSKTPEVRGLRILLEYFYATEIFSKITSQKKKVISVFGSARTRPDSEDYVMAEKVGSLLYKDGYAVVTGASRGIMQAANAGVANAIAQELVKERKAKNIDEARHHKLYQSRLENHSVGLSISLPKETDTNPFLGVNATFHYFMVRKFFFGALSSGFIACEGGWGTRDELFEILTLVQTGKAPVMPIVYLSKDYEHLERDLKHTIAKKYISEEDLYLLELVKTPEQAAKYIRDFYKNIESIKYEKDESVRVTTKKPVSAKIRSKAEHVLGEDRNLGFSLEWSGRDLVLTNYMPSSYGYLRRCVDVLNQ